MVITCAAHGERACPLEDIDPDWETEAQDVCLESDDG